MQVFDHYLEKNWKGDIPVKPSHLSSHRVQLMQAAYSTLHMWSSLWWVLAVESINGITFACFWPAGTLHCTKIAPHGMAATVQVSDTAADAILH